MNNVENKIKNIFVYLTPSLLMSIAPFITMPIITRFLTPADFGIVAVATATPVIIASVLTFNIHIGAERYYFQYRNNRVKLSCLIHTTVFFLILMLLLSLPIVFSIKDYFSTLLMGSPSYGHLIFITYMIAFLNIIVTFFLTIFRNMEEAKRFSFYTMLRMLVNISLGLVLVAVVRLGYMGLIWASFADTFILFSILFWRFNRRFPFGLDRGIFIDNLKY
ncbi:MAG: oligosaccharide flippase family protein, partial [Candidatus Omnitrophica bacterium]|nr:oligosaccharide flippase family protein [Candidatus Omnitrophota bacterium]